jgi:hypothetical protein
MQHAAQQLSAPLMTRSLAPAATSTPTHAGQALSELQATAAGTQQQQQQQEASEGVSAAVGKVQVDHQELSREAEPLKFHDILLHGSIGVVKGGSRHRVAALWARRKVRACFCSSFKMSPAVWHCAGCFVVLVRAWLCAALHYAECCVELHCAVLIW